MEEKEGQWMNKVSVTRAYQSLLPVNQALGCAEQIKHPNGTDSKTWTQKITTVRTFIVHGTCKKKNCFNPIITGRLKCI